MRQYTTTSLSCHALGLVQRAQLVGAHEGAVLVDGLRPRVLRAPGTCHRGGRLPGVVRICSSSPLYHPGADTPAYRARPALGAESSPARRPSARMPGRRGTNWFATDTRGLLGELPTLVDPLLRPPSMIMRLAVPVPLHEPVWRRRPTSCSCRRTAPPSSCPDARRFMAARSPRG